MKESLDLFFDSLVDVLFQDLCLYIPSDIILDRALKELGDSMPDYFLDEIHILDFECGFAEFEVEEFNQRLRKKRDLLDKNIFKLLRKKSEIGEFEFVYIIEKYLNQLALYIFISNWLKTNLKLYDLGKINLAMIGSFELQYECYNFHLKEFTKYFGSFTNDDFKRDFSPLELVRDYLPDMITRYDMFSKKNIFKHKDGIKISDKGVIEKEVIDTNRINKTKYIDKQKTKKLLITDTEVEEYLLENVFNIKLQ